jgi:hypothetical protein
MLGPLATHLIIGRVRPTHWELPCRPLEPRPIWFSSQPTVYGGATDHATGVFVISTMIFPCAELVILDSLLGHDV